jgi:hypothetical protein
MKTNWRQWLGGDWVALLPASFRSDKMPFVFLCMMMLNATSTKLGVALDQVASDDQLLNL